ncbi:MAG: hypothetical protein ACI9C1_001775 [Candidatus Aldehydirespiratoraceae bacterium]|jgi:hypothetical protein
MYLRVVRPVLLILVGVLAGILVVLGLAALVADDETPAEPSSDVLEVVFPAVAHDDDDAIALTVAWNRWRTASFVSSGTWTRTLDGVDAPLTGDTYTAQDPPRRLVIRLGGVLEQIDGDLRTCDGSAEGVIVPACTDASGQRGYDDRVLAEMLLVVGYVIGESRIYDVAAIDGCFQVELRPAALRSPWGRAAEFCFDESSGALWSSRVRRQTATDFEQTTAIREEVADTDF